MGDLYCTRGDLYKFGLTRGLLGAAGRLVETSTVSTDAITLDGHGFETDDEIAFRATEGGSMAAPLVAGDTYYAIRVSDSRFKVAATEGGAAIDLTTAGESMLVAISLPFDDVIEFYSRWVDGFVPAHLVPFTAPIPIMVKAIVAELSAKKLLQLAGQASQSVNDAEIVAKAQLERWSKGIPLRDAAATGPANKSVVTSIAVVGGVDPRGWGSGSIP